MKFSQATAALIIAFATAAAAHGAVPLVEGDAGGSMTALGFDASVPIQDKNKNVIEKDANTMPSKKDINANGLGTLNAKQKITMDMASKAISATPGPMPQVNKILTITYRQMVLDGTFSEAAGSKVLIDPTATGTFETGAVEAKILGTIPGDITEKQPSIQGTTVVGQDAKFQVQIPDGLVCTGPDKTCLMRVVNGKNTGNNHWGGHVIFQLAADDKAANATLTQDSTTTTDATNKKAGTKKTGTTKKAGNAARAARSIKQRQADLDDLASRLAAVQVPDS